MIKLINGDCLEEMDKLIEQGVVVDLTVTSPPYDNLRSYNGNNKQWNENVWKKVIEKLYKITKDGEVVVWVVGDATIKGSETGTSFKQALYFKECGFNLHDTMIYAKNNYIPLTHRRYEQQFEYMFIFSKGKPKTFNPIKIPTKTAGTKINRIHTNKEKGSGMRARNEYTETKKYKYKPNIWFMNVSNTKASHPAIFPQELATDQILSWSNENDTVLDTFMGSGTTGEACKNTNRNFIGIELDKGYYDIAVKRIQG